jgi:hypothetical protein
MSPLSPAALLVAQATDHGADPQLANGIHLRIVPSAELGLPLLPLLVYRMNLGHSATGVQARTDITWRDSRGQFLTMPFTVTPDAPVTGYLPAMASGVCCWIEIDARPELSVSGFRLAGQAIGAGSGLGLFGPHLQVAALVSNPLGDAVVARASTPAYQLAASRIERVLVSGQGVVTGVRWVDARTLNPPASDLWRVLALPVPSGARYAGIAQAAQRAKERVLRGAPVREPLYEDATAADASATPAATPADDWARVQSRTPPVAAWLDMLLNDLSQTPQELISAPEPLLDDDGIARGTASVYALGSTLAAGLDPSVGRWLGLVELDENPAAVAAPGDVLAYVIRGFWRSEPQRPVIGAGPAAPQPVSERVAARFGTASFASASSNLLCVAFGRMKPGITLPVPLVLSGFTFRSAGRGRLRIGTSLPGGTVPELEGPQAGIVVELPYPVGAVQVLAGALGGEGFTVTAQDAAGQELTSASSAAAEGVVVVEAQGIAQVTVAPSEPSGKGIALVRICIPGTPAVPPGRGTLWDLATVACATLGHPSDPPPPPSLGAPVSGDWMPALPPTAIREIDMPVSGLVPGALLAYARREGASVTALNPVDANGLGLPLAAAPPADAIQPGQGTLDDRSAPPEAVAYRAAQADWFGRWSPWAEVAAGAGTRPLPPTPAVTAFYQPASFGDPVPSGTLAGTVRVRVPVPPTAALPAGANLLDHLEVTIDGVLSSVALPGAADDAELETSGPALAQCEQRTIEVTAQWVDTAGVASAVSDPVQLLCVDPRPPSQVTLPNTLLYASRPDVTGKSRVTLQWTVTPEQQRFRIFYADERTLQSKLALISADGSDPRQARARQIAAAITDGMNAPDRAAVYRGAADFFTREWWDQLTNTPVEASGASASFEHTLSGSLRLVSFYRVLAVSAANVDAYFTSSAMVAYGVPNTLPPAKPVLTASLDPTAPPGQARVHVRVPPGPVNAARYRLRRSSTTGADALHMPVAGSGSVPAVTPGTVGQDFDVVDTGPTSVSDAPLRNWVRYTWRVEVQGPDEPGGGPPGEWSQASDPVSAMLVPPGAPAAPTSLIAASAGSGEATVTWKHPDALLGGTAGSYMCEVYRQAPGQRERRAPDGIISADAPPSAGGRAPDRTGTFSFTDAGPVATGTSYRVVVVDPIGRRGTPSSQVTVS